MPPRAQCNEGDVQGNVASDGERSCRSERPAARMAFVHNTIMPYRRPFFELLDQHYDMDLILVDPDATSSIYGVSIKKAHLRPIMLSGLFKHLRLIRLLLRGRYDVIVDSLERRAILSFILSRVTRTPVLYWSEEWGRGRARFANSLLFPLSKFVARNADGLLVPGSNHKTYFRVNGVPEDKIIVMPNASDLTFRPLGGKTEMSVLKDELDIAGKVVILFVGRLVKQKGIEYLLQALSMMAPGWSLVVAGGGENKASLIKLANQLGIANDVRFLDWVRSEELYRYYNMADVVVVPSTTIGGLTDAWVFVLNEAMLYGKAIIATEAVGAAPDLIIDGENGFIVPERDADALLVALERTIADRAFERMGNRSKELITGFDYEVMAEAFDKAVIKALPP